MEKKTGMVRSLSIEVEVPVASAGGESVIAVSLGTEGANGTSLMSSGGGASVTGPMPSILGASPGAGIWSSEAGAGAGVVCAKPTAP